MLQRSENMLERMSFETSKVAQIVEASSATVQHTATDIFSRGSAVNEQARRLQGKLEIHCESSRKEAECVG
jgi:hypothetical protein